MRWLRSGGYTWVLVLLVGVMLATARSAVAASTPEVSPAPGAVLVSSPAEVQVTLPSAPPAGSQLQVLDAAATDRNQGGTTISGDTLRVQLPALGAGTYTILWQAGSRTGASTFTVWHGGGLPAPVVRALRGGPGPAPAALPEGLLLGLALAEAAVAIGGLAYGRKRSLTAQRSAGLLLAASATAAALLRTSTVAATLGDGHLALSTLWGGLPLIDLMAALAGLLAAVVAEAAPLAALLSGAAGLMLLASIPALRASAPGVFALSVVAYLGLSVFAGAWPHAWRTSIEPAPLLRWVGVGAALAAGVPLLSLWHPLGGVAATLAVLCALLSVLLGRPGRRRGMWALGGALVGIVPLILLAPALARSSPRAGRPRSLPAMSMSATTGSSGVRFFLSSSTAGTQTLGLAVPGLTAPQVTVQLQSLQYPSVRWTVPLARLRAGSYAATSGALSLPGGWKAKVAGATFAFDLHAPNLAEVCPAGMAGLPLAEVTLGAPVRAIVTAADDGDVALAATAAGVFSTADGGRHWLPAGHLAGVTALAIGQHGKWFAATPAGLLESTDGGRTWSPTPIHGAVDALVSPLYPTGLGIWALGQGRVLHRPFGATIRALSPYWTVVGTAPAGVTAPLPLPPSTGGYTATGILAADTAGLVWSPNGGRTWQQAPAPPGTISTLAAGPTGLWAAGSGGVFFASRPTGPWHQVPVGIGTDPASVAVAANGAVLVDLDLQGVFLRAPGARNFRRIGCWSPALTALAGTYHAGGPVQDTATTTLAYWGDAEGDVVALLPVANLPLP